MSTNERLLESGLLKSFEEAVRDGDRALAESILLEVEVETPRDVVDLIFENPARYGFA